MTTHAAFLGSVPPSSTLGTSLRRSHRFTIRAQAADPSDKSVEIMRKFSEQYARKSGTYFCVDKGVTAVVIKGLADHKDSLGAPLCPCIMTIRPLKQDKDFGTALVKECHCMLFLTPDNDFAGQEQACPSS
ncbi:Ferredoxin-thioredoxin reductase catalytic chain [Carex littledalei]|uniref:Ferredoxin-thioredoxin reductase catalytic chain, chloroplastic n=1 Tax=Carex littledalei TaxID=544730 RepID=A0A833QRU0_9POAL|nr:Ferredoxin-thioredoxin reductase catalytic chain [Carex littledalei]